MAWQRGDTTQWPGLALAVLAGLAATAFGHAPPALTPSSACPGLPELATFGLARLTPDVPVSVWITRSHDIVLILGVAWTSLLAQRLTGRLLIGTAVGGAVAAWATASPEFVMFHGAGPLAVAAVLWPICAGRPPMRRIALCVALAGTAAMWPTSTVACALLFVAASRTMGATTTSSLLGASVVAGTGTIVLRAAMSAAPLPLLGSCLIPDLRLAAVSHSVGALVGAGPYVLALAALGIFIRRQDVRAWLWMGVAFFLLCSPQAFASAAPPTLAIAAASGLLEVIRLCRGGPGGRLAAVLLVALLPALAWQSALAAPAADPSAGAFGHDRLSLTLMRRLVAARPAGALLLSEDATTDAVARAARPGFATSTISRDPNQVSDALSRGDRVLAFPVAQVELKQLGFRLDDVLPGLAEVHAGGACQLATSEWRSLGGFDAAGALTLAARTPAEAGPVVAYAAFDTRPVLGASAWPAVARRGFYTTVYDLGSTEERAHLRQDVSDDGAPVGALGGGRPFVARLELWRTPTAPLRLTVTLGAQPHDVLARVIAKAGARRLSLCPSYPHAIRRMGE